MRSGALSHTGTSERGPAPSQVSLLAPTLRACAPCSPRENMGFPQMYLLSLGETCHDGTWGIFEALAHKSCCVIGRVLPMLRPTQTPHQLSWRGAKPQDQVALSPPSPSLPPPRGLLSCGAKCRLLARCPAPRQVQWPGPHSPGPKVLASPGSSNPSA